MIGKAGSPIRKWIEHPWPNHNNVNQSIVIIITKKPKLMVQIKKFSDVEKLVEKRVFGNVGENLKTRLTKPKTHNGMVRDVPITHDDIS